MKFCFAYLSSDFGKEKINKIKSNQPTDLTHQKVAWGVGGEDNV